MSENEARTFRERFEDQICRYQPVLYYLFVFQFIFLAMAVFSILHIDPNSPSYTILLIDFLILGTTLLTTTLVLSICNQRK